MVQEKEIKRRDPVKTKAKILNESTLLFAQKGYSGCSINNIIAKAKINKRMIYHYFGDKDGLYRAVFINQWNKMKEHFDQATAEDSNIDLSAANLKKTILKAHNVFFDYVVENPVFLPLLQWESLEGGKISRNIGSESHSPIFFKIKFLFDEAQEKGLLSKKFATDHLVVTALGAMSFYFTQANSMGGFLGTETPLSESAIQKRKEQMIVLLDQIIQS